MTMIQEPILDFTGGDLEPSGYDQFDATGTVVADTDVTAPISASGIAKEIMAVDFPGGERVVGWEHGYSDVTKRCVQTISAHKWSSNYKGHPTGNNKLIVYFIGDGYYVVLECFGDGSEADEPPGNNNGTYFYPGFALQGGEDLAIPGSVAVTRNAWWRAKVQIVSNTLGNANGSVKLWVDTGSGWVLSVNQSGLRIVPDSAPDTNQASFIAGTIWGGVDSVVTEEQYAYWDHLDPQVADSDSEFTDAYEASGTPTASAVGQASVNVTPTRRRLILGGAATVAASYTVRRKVLAAAAGIAVVTASLGIKNTRTVAPAGSAVVAATPHARRALSVAVNAGATVDTHAIVTVVDVVAGYGVGDVIVAEVTAYDPDLATERTLYFSTHGFSSKPTDTPANTHFDEVLTQPTNVRRDIFANGTTLGRSRIGSGDMELTNGDGRLDFLKDMGLDGRRIVLRRGRLGTAYPTEWPSFFIGTMEQPEVSSKSAVIRMRDRQFEMDAPLQPTKFDGDNVLPDGLEGVSDLAGKPKPVTMGSVLNVPAICVNTSKLVHQVHDGQLEGIPTVYDEGIPLFPDFPCVARTNPFTSADTMCFTSSPSLFVMAGENWQLATSTDGVTWTLRLSTFSIHTIYGLAYGNGMYVAAGDNGRIETSTDGTTWTARTSGFGTTSIRGLTYSTRLGLFVAVGLSGKISTSPDGITWTSRTSGVVGALFGVIDGGRVGAGVLVVPVFTDGSILTSPDGITWTSTAAAVGGIANGSCVGWGNSMFVLCGNAGEIVTSLDGYIWTRRPDVFGSSVIRSIVFANGRFVAVGDLHGSVNMITSVNGITWNAIESGVTTNIQAVGYGLNKFALGEITGTAGIHTSGFVGTYASEAELLDDSLAPAAGTYKVHLASGRFRLGSIPAGQITADVTEGSSASDRTAGQLFTRVLTRAGKTSADWNATDIATLDANAPYMLGLWENEETTFNAVLDKIANSVGAWWSVDNDGVFRIQQLTEPTGIPIVSFTANDFVVPLERVITNDQGRGLPAWRVIAKYAKNYTVQNTDLAAGVEDARRAVLSQEWLSVDASDDTVVTRHLLAPQFDLETLLQDADDAQAEADRILALRSVDRDHFTFTTALTRDTVNLDLGNVVRITHSRFGLSAGKLFRIIGIEPNAKQRRIAFNVWG